MIPAVRGREIDCPARQATSRFSRLTLILTLALAVALVGPSPSSLDATDIDPTVLLISIDGFRWDFTDRAPTPNLDRLTAQGVRSERLIPAFPSKTFPNHYTLVTGLYPSHHGLVANNMWDPVFGASYGLSNREEVENGRWYGGEPIWVTAERQGQHTAPLFWPGSEAAIGGTRPTYWENFDDDMPHKERVARILRWLELPREARPTFLTLYFSDVDHAAHEFGPAPSKGLRKAIRRVDKALGQLLKGLKRLRLEDLVDIIVVSDHGMSATSPERVILLDQHVDPLVANVIDWNPVLALWPLPERVDEIFEALHGAHPHLAVFRRDEVPKHFHFRGHPRIAPIIGIADDGWSISTQTRLESCPECFSGGTHGYDPSLESMGALFLASGPSFRQGVTVAPFENIHIYALMCKILGLQPAPNDGSLETTKHLLRSAK